MWYLKQSQHQGKLPGLLLFGSYCWHIKLLSQPKEEGATETLENGPGGHPVNQHDSLPIPPPRYCSNFHGLSSYSPHLPHYPLSQAVCTWVNNHRPSACSTLCREPPGTRQAQTLCLGCQHLIKDHEGTGTCEVCKSPGRCYEVLDYFCARLLIYYSFIRC